MKFVISNSDLISILNKIQNIVPQKSTIPILSNILIEAQNDELIFTATDLTVGIRCYTEAKILEEGSTTIPAKKFVQLIRELTATHVEINTIQDITEIKADSSRFKLHGMNKSEYPSLPDLAGATQFKIKQSELRDMFFRTSFAVSREDNRYVLTGVLMKIQNGTALFAGTDGKRLARTITKIALDPSISGDFIIPLKAVDEMQKNLQEEGEATIYLMNDKIAVEANKCVIITKLLTGEYPDIARVIPETTETQVSLHKDELMSLLRQISLFTTDPSQPVRFTFADGELKLVACAMEIGEGKVSMPVNYFAPKLDIAFNPDLLLGILRHTNPKVETVNMSLIDAYNPGLITENLPVVDPNQEVAAASIPTLQASPLFVLMPMRLNEE